MHKGDGPNVQKEHHTKENEVAMKEMGLRAIFESELDPKFSQLSSLAEAFGISFYYSVARSMQNSSGSQVVETNK